MSAEVDRKTGAEKLCTVLRPGIGLGDRQIDRCRRANRIVSSARSAMLHPAIVTHRRPDGRVQLTSAPLDALCVGELVANGPLPPGSVIAILRQICHALDVLHRAGLTHGALSTSSVLINCGKDRPDAVCVADVGVGELIDSAATMGDASIAWQPLSPEKVLGLSRDHREDVYLIGLVGFAMLYGRPSYQGTDADEVRRRHAIEDPPTLEELGDQVALRPIAALVNRCMAKEPEDRFQTVAEIDTALVAAQQEADITTPWDDLATLVPFDPAIQLTPDTRSDRTPSHFVVGEPPTVVDFRVEDAEPVEAPGRPPQRQGTGVRAMIGYVGIGAAMAGIVAGVAWPQVNPDPPPPAPEATAPVEPEIVVAAPVEPAPVDFNDDPVPAAEPSIALGEPAVSEPSIALGDPDIGEEVDEKEMVANLVKRARKAAHAGRDRDAEFNYRQAIQLEPRALSALAGLGRLYLERGDYKRAAKYTQMAVRIAPKSAKLRQRLARAYRKLGRKADADHQLAEARASSSGDAPKPE